MSEMSLSDVLPGSFPPEPPSNGRRGVARAARRRKKRKRRRAFLVIAITFFVVGGAIAGSYLGLAPVVKQLTAPKDFTGEGTGKAVVKIPNGASGRTIARVLATAGVIKTEVAFTDVAKLDKRAAGIQPGTYQLRKQMSAAAAITLLLDPKSRLTTPLSIPEGTRVADIIKLMVKKLDMNQGKLEELSKSTVIGLPKAARGRPEGFLFPATYDFPPDVTEAQALSAMVARGKKAFTKLNIAPADLRQVVIKASIVQAEAGNKNYMGKVATVIDNRLKGKINLQLDSTVSYATNRFDITTSAAERNLSSGYNTYKYRGLPAGPIDNPGEEALSAVLNPTPGPWLFFVTTNPDTGETKFAVNSTAHGVNVREFQAWLRQNPKK